MKQTIYQDKERLIEFPNRAIIVGCHCNNQEKEDITIAMLEGVREKYKNGILLIVASHLSLSKELQKHADYVVVNKNNPIMNRDLINDTTLLSLYGTEVYRSNGQRDFVSRPRFNHSYAHHLLIKDAFDICVNNEIEFVHFLNYDVPVDKCLEEIDHHMVKLKLEDYDGVFYYYHFKMFYNTEFFSMTTSAYSKYLKPIKSFKDWTQNEHIDTEQNYRVFLEDANISCDDIFHKDVSDIIGEISFDNDIGEAEEVSVLNSKVSNMTVIPYIKDGQTIINTCFTRYNDPATEKTVKWESLDDDKNHINFYEAVVSQNNWCDYVCPDNCRYVKIYINHNLKAFFDIKDKRNIGKCE